jgi:polyphosphate kinase
MVAVRAENARAALAEVLDLALDPSILAWELAGDGSWHRVPAQGTGRDYQEELLRRAHEQSVSREELD